MMDSKAVGDQRDGAASSGRRQGMPGWHPGSAAALQCSPGESQHRGEVEDESHGEEQRRPIFTNAMMRRIPATGERLAAAKRSRRGEIFSVFHVKRTEGRGIKGEENSRDAKGHGGSNRGSIL